MKSEREINKELARLREVERNKDACRFGTAGYREWLEAFYMIQVLEWVLNVRSSGEPILAIENRKDGIS